MGPSGDSVPCPARSNRAMDQRDRRGGRAGDDALEHLARELIGEGAGVDEDLQGGDVRRSGEIGRLAALGIGDAGDLTRPPLAGSGL